MARAYLIGTSLATATLRNHSVSLGFDAAAGRLPVVMRGRSSLNSRPDEQSQRCADDHAKGDLGASAGQHAEDDADRRAQYQPQSRCLRTSVRVASHPRSPVAATALLRIDHIATPL